MNRGHRRSEKNRQADLEDADLNSGKPLVRDFSSSATRNPHQLSNCKASPDSDSNGLVEMCKRRIRERKAEDIFKFSHSKPNYPFLEDREIQVIKHPKDLPASTSTRIRNQELSVKRFEDRIESLHRHHKISELKSSIRALDVEGGDRNTIMASIHSVVFRKPAKKTLFRSDEPLVKRISFGSRRRTCEFNIIHKEEFCLRNSELFGNMLRSTGADDDCDTDDPELERALAKCKMDLCDGLNRYKRKNKPRKSKTVEPAGKKFHRRATSMLHIPF